MTNPQPLRRIRPLASPVREQVADAIREQIVNGALPPGQRLIERDLCEQLDVSRNTLREAYRQLEAEGFVELQPHKGPMVSRISRQEAKSLYELRESLEGLAIRLFTERAGEQEIAELKASHVRLMAAHESNNVLEMLHCKNAFYDVLYSGAHNEPLRNQARVLRGRLSQLRARSLSDPSRPKQSIAEISAVVTKIAARDALGAADAWCRHIRTAWAVLEQSWPDEGDD